MPSTVAEVTTPSTLPRGKPRSSRKDCARATSAPRSPIARSRHSGPSDWYATTTRSSTLISRSPLLISSPGRTPIWVTTPAAALVIWKGSWYSAVNSTDVASIRSIRPAGATIGSIGLSAVSGLVTTPETSHAATTVAGANATMTSTPVSPSTLADETRLAVVSRRFETVRAFLQGLHDGAIDLILGHVGVHCDASVGEALD